MEYAARSQTPRKTALCVALCALVSLTACGTRTVYVPATQPMRLRKPIKHAAVWIPDKNGIDIPGTVTLQEGWWTLDATPEDQPNGTHKDR